MMCESSYRHQSYLKQIQSYIARLPGLSTTAAKVLATCNNPGSSPNDLNRVISLDPVLTGQVLRLINSAYYSLRHPVSSLTRAIIMLGVNTVKNLVLSLAILAELRGKKSFQALSAQKFWVHSLGVGVIAKCIAVVKGVSLADQEDFFVSGLLHDLGKIPLNRQFADEYFKVVDIAKRSGRSLAHAEKVVFGIDHGSVGGLIAEKWRLSPALMEALACHHQPDGSAQGHQQLVLIVALANIIAQRLNMDTCEATAIGDVSAEYLLDRLGMDWPAVYDLQPTVYVEIEKGKIFLEMTV